MTIDGRPPGPDSVADPPSWPAPALSVVMVVFHTGPSLWRAIASVMKEPQVDYLVVVDNGSTPEDAAELRAIAARERRFVLVQGQGNVGFARGCNLGVREAPGQHLIVLNPDAYLQPGCVTALFGVGSGFSSPRIIGARVLNTDGSEQRGSRRGEVTPLTTLLSITQLATAVPFLRRFDIHRDADAVPEGPIAVPTISGACFYVSREDFERLGGFDERYFLHVEDIDLCWRARKAGGSVVFQPKALVLHEGSTSRVSSLRVELHKGRGLVRYFIKRADTLPSLALAVALSPLIMLASAVRPLMKAVGGPARGRLN